MSEQRARIEYLAIIDLFPLIRRAIGGKTLCRQRMRWRTKPKNVEQQALIVALPTVWDKTAFRPPTMSQCWSIVAGPVPIGTAIEPVGQSANLGLVGSITVEVRGYRQSPSEQER